MLNVGVFDSKQHFLDGLQASFGGGTFLLGNRVSGTDIGAYISYLKNDYAEQERQRKFKEAEYIGFQEGSYWLLSSEVIDQNFAKVFIFCVFFLGRFSFLLEDLYGRLSAIHRTVVP